ncbi:MAG: Dabb family protein [Pseudomonadota bacterium]
MIAHCVFLSFSSSQTEEARRAILCALVALAETLDGVIAVQAGPNRDFEAKSPNHSHGFILHFRDRGALRAYDEHPRHRELGKELVSMCVGGADGLVVYDIEY